MKYIFYLFIMPCIICACNRQKSNKELAIAMFDKGLRLEEKNVLDSAVIAYHQTLDLLKHSKQYKLSGVVYNQLGSIFLKNDLENKAIKAYETGYEYNSKMEDKTLASKSLRGIGKAYAFLTSFNTSIYYYKQALQFSDQIYDKSEIASIYNNLTVSYHRLGQLDTAIYYSTKSIRYENDTTNLYKDYSLKGIILIDLKQYDSAWTYLTLASKSNNIYTRASCYRRLSNLASILGKENSVKYLKLYQTINDSIDRKKQTAPIVEIELQNELKQLKEKNKAESRYWMSAIGVIILTIILFFVLKYIKKKKHISQLQKIITEKTEHNFNIEKKLAQIQEVKSREILQATLVKEKNAQLFIEMGHFSAKRLVATKSYSKIKKCLSESVNINETDLNQFHITVFKIFKNYLEILESNFPELTTSDCYYCFLVISGFTHSECTVLMKKSTEALNTQKSRLKRKLSVPFNEIYMFELIFLNIK